MNCRFRSFFAAAGALMVATGAPADVLINEIFFDPPAGGGDRRYEYIELRGTPGLSLDDHYLLFLENEGQPDGLGGITGDAGRIDAFFDFSGVSLGTNGFLIARQSEDFFGNPNPYTVAPGATDLLNDSGRESGWGNLDKPSTIGWNSDGTGNDGQVIENSGFTALLIRVDSQVGAPPVVGYNMDEGNDGLDPLPAGWTILDGIGVHSEPGEAASGRLYAAINFGAGPSARIEPGAVYIETDFEIEYVGRLGDSTGSAAGDWWVGNLTDDPRRPGAGITFTLPGFVMSAADTPAGQQTGDLESSTDQFPYGMIITNTLGAPNHGVPEGGVLAGDMNGDGVLDAFDVGPFELALADRAAYAAAYPGIDPDLVGDFDSSGVLDAFDVGGFEAALAGGAAVPEPGTLVLLPALGAGLTVVRRRPVLRAPGRASSANGQPHGAWVHGTTA